MLDAVPAIRLRQLRTMKCFHALDGHFDRIRHLVVDRHLARGDLDLGRRERDAVESRDLFGDVRVAARAHAGDHLVGDEQGIVSEVGCHDFAPPSSRA